MCTTDGLSGAVVASNPDEEGDRVTVQTDEGKDIGGDAEETTGGGCIGVARYRVNFVTF